MSFPRPAGKVLSINDSGARNWQAKRRLLQPWRDEMGWAWLQLPMAQRQTITQVPCQVQITIGFATNALRDPHNYVGTICKALVDQLVKQGVWPDDTPQWVSVAEPVCVKGDRVTVRLVPRTKVDPGPRVVP